MQSVGITGEEENRAAEAAEPAPEWIAPVPSPQPWFFLIRWGSLVLAMVGAIIVALAIRRHFQGDVYLSASFGDPDWAPLVGGGILLILGLSTYVFRPDLGHLRRLVLTSAVWSLTLLVGQCLLWVLINSSTVQVDWVGLPVLDQQEVQAAFDERFPSAADATRIRTGVQIQSVEFRSAANVDMTGYVWQFWPDDAPSDLTPGFVLPDALHDAYSASEAYRRTVPGGEVIGWYFAATLRQSFDYQYFPFERENIWLRMWPRDFDRPVVLVPDFAAYKNLTPTTLPGIETSFVHGGWHPMYSGFSLSAESYNVDFGTNAALAIADFPELYFNFVLRRDFVGPFTDHIIYSAAVALLLFGLLALTSNNDATRGRFGITTAGVLGSCGVFLFGVITKHNQIRTSLDTQQVTYLEVIPILLYVMIVLVALNAIVVASPINVAFLEYRDNRLPELVYWPILLGVLFIITYLVFF